MQACQSVSACSNTNYIAVRTALHVCALGVCVHMPMHTIRNLHSNDFRDVPAPHTTNNSKHSCAQAYQSESASTNTKYVAARTARAVAHYA